MERLIPLINQLQDVFSNLGLTFVDLPQIAVVGSQSSGKSSVLENIVGIDFLPRGSGIVTRRPLVLQLRNLPPGSNEEWGEFLHVPNKKFHSFEEVRDEIVRDTNRSTGQLGISPQPINLKIYSPNVVDLTLIDLPGITKVPVGDQPPDIEIQIRNMLMSFIEKKNCIILAVTAANSDLANSDALQLAKSADPEGERTIGVITKLDLMDQGTDASDILQGKIIPLKRGFIGVVNRSQKAINEKMSMREARAREADYFRSHPVYNSMMSILGTSILSTTLNKMLIGHIKVCLPDIRKNVTEKLLKVSADLEELGGPLQSMSDKKTVLVSILNSYSKEFRNAIDGRSVDMNITELYGGARIAYIFRDVFSPALMNLDPCHNLKDEDIRNAIRNSTGVGQSLFMPRVVSTVIQRQLIRLRDPSIECARYVLDELIRISTTVNKKRFRRFEDLQTAIHQEVAKFLKDLFGKTAKKIEAFMEAQMSHISLDHPDCMTALDAMTEANHFKKKKTLMSYVPDSVRDSLPKKEYNQVNATMSTITAQLRSGYLYKQGATMKAWKKRFFNFDGLYLLYFNSDAKGEKARGQVHMRNASIKGLDPRQFEGYCFQVKTADKILILKADSEEDMKKWILSLMSAQSTREDQTEPVEDGGGEASSKKQPKDEQGGENKSPRKHPNQSSSSVPAPPPKQNPAPSRKPASSLVGQRRPGSRRKGGSLLNRYFVPDELVVHLPEVPYSIHPAINPQELKQTELVKAMLRSYFDVVRKLVRDAVPKAVMVFLVNKAKEDLQFSLGTLFGQQSLDELLKESGAIAAQREQLDKEQQALRKAVKILQEVENLNLEKAAAGEGVPAIPLASSFNNTSSRPRPPSPPKSSSFSTPPPPAPYIPTPPQPQPSFASFPPTTSFAPPPSSSFRPQPPPPTNSFGNLPPPASSFNFPPQTSSASSFSLPLPPAPTTSSFSINAPPPIPPRAMSPGPAPASTQQSYGFGPGSPGGQLLPKPPTAGNPFLPPGGPAIPAMSVAASPPVSGGGQISARPAGNTPSALAPAPSATPSAQNVDWMKMFQSTAGKK
mmetsp:Transcript_20517/g.33754  ORF Transcript_20517/g.33754 Transcript_20517/m.33754 type:complete len:1065 (+) Transcript_20517:158-3352(+)|eukprot:CAMPEP_0184651456 /NCGR_PEP_ID=MMETSP0308-20130426/9062_1 /TAXON_ID=38269 /ORGANISM="Gloeochaete witrockiana, Strain SAG 46.84" /LENGTH=1064 /DNA_ID=CAMNT_0027085683 /DNA_START=107 /DNA_END=3304 /DNA_ORIENTATION=+